MLADPIYNSTLVEKFICSMMWDGKKTVAQRIFYDSMDKIRDRSGDDPLKLFKKAVENSKPLLEVKTRRVGGANYQVPIEVPQNRRTSLAIRWIVSNARVAAGKGHAGEAGERIERRRQHARRSDQEKGRCPPHGGGQQGFRALPVVRTEIDGTRDERIPGDCHGTE